MPILIDFSTCCRKIHTKISRFLLHPCKKNYVLFDRKNATQLFLVKISVYSYKLYIYFYIFLDNDIETRDETNSNIEIREEDNKSAHSK